MGCFEQSNHELRHDCGMCRTDFGNRQSLTRRKFIGNPIAMKRSCSFLFTSGCFEFASCNAIMKRADVIKHKSNAWWLPQRKDQNVNHTGSLKLLPFQTLRYETCKRVGITMSEAPRSSGNLLSVIHPKEIGVQYCLHNSSQDSDLIKVVFGEVPVYPIGNIEGSVDA